MHNDLPTGRKMNSDASILLSMAHDRSETGRIALVEKIAEMFLMNSEAMPEKEELLVRNFIQEIIDNESEVIRQTLIQKFAAATHAVRSVAVRISRAPIEIARPTLVANENLNDNDLISIISAEGNDHALAIATRTQISEAVSDALIATGNLEVAQIVASNLGAKLSKKAVDVLVLSARIATRLHEPLLSRPELTPEKAAELYWWISKELRKNIADRYGFGPGRLDIELNKTITEKLKVHLIDKDDERSMIQLANWLAERDAMTTELLPQVLRMNHFRLFSVLMSRLSGLELSLVDAIIMSKEARMIVALFRAMDINKASFVSLFLMSRAARNDEQIVNPKELSVALSVYDRLSVQDSRYMIESWRRNPSALILLSMKEVD